MELNDRFIGPDGRTLFFGVNSFRSVVCSGESCFYCGAPRGSKRFNDEHVIPRWLLRKHNMFDQTIGLPNRTSMVYSQYTVPCCQECNSFLGQAVEKPVRDLFAGGYKHLVEYLKREGPWLLSVWLALVFFKTHLKDVFLRAYRDQRKPQFALGDIYEWEDLHHAYCIARIPYVPSTVQPAAFGSVFVLPTVDLPGITCFDYCDFFKTQSVLIRSNDIGIVAVLNDGFAVHSVLRTELIPRITGRVTPIQLREILARAAYTNSLVANPPDFGSTVAPDTGEHFIHAQTPESVELEEEDPKRLGGIMMYLLKESIPLHDPSEQDLVEQRLRSGKATYLFDENDQFVNDSPT